MTLFHGLESSPLTTPLGQLTLIASGQGLRAVLWPGESLERFIKRCVSLRDESLAPPPSVHPPAAVLRAAADQLDDYFAGERTTFDLPLDPLGTPFQHVAWKVLQAIPFGTTISYGEQASRLGDSRKARAVGAANGRNPIPIIIPCHRVIGADGSLTGFAAGVESKAWLLRHERGLVEPTGCGLFERFERPLPRAGDALSDG